MPFYGWLDLCPKAPGSAYKLGRDTWPGCGLRVVALSSHADLTIDSVNDEPCSVFSYISKKITPVRKMGGGRGKKHHIFRRVLLSGQESRAIVRGEPML